MTDLTRALDALEAEAIRDIRDDYPLMRVPPAAVLALIECARAADNLVTIPWAGRFEDLAAQARQDVRTALARLAKALEGR